MPYFISLLLVLGAAGLNTAAAADIALIGVIGDKAAVFAVDGGDPKAVKVGQKWKGITVIAVERERATVEIDGKRSILTRGQHYRNEAGSGGSTRQSVILASDPSGHFITEGAINGTPVRFLVDTGATLIALPGRDADRLGIDYRKGPRGKISTANGAATAYQVTFDRVKLGGIELMSVEGVVIEQGLDIALLGMSFLNRVDMRREGQTMTLLRRY
jgi:aspartyl protease family protein